MLTEYLIHYLDILNDYMNITFSISWKDKKYLLKMEK